MKTEDLCNSRRSIDFIDRLCKFQMSHSRLEDAELVKFFTFFFLNFRHDVAQIGGLIAMSFGVEDVDRYIVVYKKDRGPSEDEIFARRNGEEWNDETAKKYAHQVRLDF